MRAVCPFLCVLRACWNVCCMNTPLFLCRFVRLKTSSVRYDGDRDKKKITTDFCCPALFLGGFLSQVPDAATCSFFISALNRFLWWKRREICCWILVL